VLIKRLESEEKTAGGIIIPDTAQEKPQEGLIVAVGSGAKSEEGKVTPLDVKVGDKVLFGKWSGTEIKVDGVELCIMKSQILWELLLTQNQKLRKRKNKYLNHKENNNGW